MAGRRRAGLAGLGMTFLKPRNYILVNRTDITWNWNQQLNLAEIRRVSQKIVSDFIHAD